MKNFLRKTSLFVKKYITIFIILFIFLFLFVCDKIPSKTGSAIMDNLKSIATTFTPTTDLFDDGSEVSFVSYFFGMKATIKNEKAEFQLPTSNKNLSNSDDFLCYSFSGVVNLVSNGKVSSIGYTANGEKYIEFEHNENYVSRYVGLTTIGVTLGEKCYMGKPVGIASAENILKIYIHKNSNLVKISEIEWKN